MVSLLIETVNWQKHISFWRGKLIDADSLTYVVICGAAKLLVAFMCAGDSAISAAALLALRELCASVKAPRLDPALLDADDDGVQGAKDMRKVLFCASCYSTVNTLN
jgi:hypothetical protein